MAEVAELDTAPDTIEATVNYLKDTGEMPWTYSGGPGSTEVKSSSTPDPRRVTIRNGRARGRFHPRARRLPLRAPGHGDAEFSRR